MLSADEPREGAKGIARVNPRPACMRRAGRGCFCWVFLLIDRSLYDRSISSPRIVDFAEPKLSASIPIRWSIESRVFLL